MKKGLFILAVLSSASFAVADQIIYDGFNYDTTSGPFLGTGPGSGVGAFGKWIYQGNNTVEPRIETGNLTYTGLPASTGNFIQLDNTVPTGADASRLYIGTVNKATTPTLYYSMVVNVPTSTASAIPFFAGFDNLNAGTTYDSWGAMFIKQDGAGFDLGIGTNGSANRVFSSALPINTPIFVVASFTFQGVSTLDIYTNPTAIPTSAPATHQLTSLGNDNSTTTTVTNFYLRGNSGEPQGIQVDELRIGTSFTDVTPHSAYWDINGATAGAGGATPSGVWDGTTTNFNTDPTGGGAGLLIAAPAAIDAVNFSAGSDATGSYTISVSSTQAAGAANITSGSVTLDGGTLKVGVFNVTAGASGTVTSVVAGGTTGVTKAGAGPLTFTSANTYTGGTTVAGGSLKITNAGALGGGAVIVNDGALLATNNSLGAPISIGKVTIDGSGQFDVNNNTLIINYTGNSPAATVRGYLVSGFNAGSWNGPGLESSAAQSDASFRTALGYSDNGSSITVKFTQYGDANLDGTVNVSDFQMFIDGMAAGGSTWSQGDFSYDGKVDLGNDFNLLLENYLADGGSMGDLAAIVLADDQLSDVQKASLLAAVPEPTMVAPLCAAAMLVRRRRARRTVS